jgi:hypothetical protein
MVAGPASPEPVHFPPLWCCAGGPALKGGRAATWAAPEAAPSDRFL